MKKALIWAIKVILAALATAFAGTIVSDLLKDWDVTVGQVLGLSIYLTALAFWLWAYWDWHTTRPFLARLRQQETDLVRRDTDLLGRERSLKEQRRSLERDVEFWLDNQQLPGCDTFPSCIRDRINVECKTYPACIEDRLCEQGILIDPNLYRS